MISLVAKLGAPAALTLLLVWRATSAWNGPEPPTLPPIRQPKDHVLSTELPKAMTFHWVRPLFSIPQPAKLVKPAGSLPQSESSETASRLVGVIGDGENPVALMAIDSRLVRSYRGSKIGAWTVLAIDARSIVLEKRGETMILYLDQKHLGK